MRKLVMLLGEPCSGKTTVARKVIEGLREANSRVMSYKWKEVECTLYFPEMIGVLGIYKGETFDGTDKLALHTQPQALELLAELENWAWFVEGDRYATPSFLERARQLGDVYVAALLVAPPVLEQRRAQRAKVQDPTWLAGRHTKFMNLAATYATDLLEHNFENETEPIVRRIVAALAG